jgi:hypothetical protein
MTVYITKVWGFSEPCGPLQFSTEGWRDRARRDLAEGDLVVEVGTMREPTEEGERGRVLGIMEPTTETVASLDFELRRAPHDFDDDDNYRWPYGLLNRRAWILEERPLLSEVSDRAFSMDAVLGIVPLSDDEAAKVLALRRREVELLAPVRALARVEGAEAARRRAAPPPTTTRAGSMHMRRASAYTYCMEVEGAEKWSFKIGWAFDYTARERQFNQSALPQIGGLRYRTKLEHLWDTAREAYAMEQDLLRHFDTRRHPANREILFGVAYKEIKQAWIDGLLRRSRRRS